MASTNDLPSVATEGFRDAQSYDAHRPSYPPEAVEAFLKNMKVTGMSDIRILEIASGTGKFTEQLAKRPERFIVKAVEPHETMRQKLAEKDLPAVEVVNGSANKIPVEEEWGDACIAAQVDDPKVPWKSNSGGKHLLTSIIGIPLVEYTGSLSLHVSVLTVVDRFATEDALREMHRVLRPGAVFGMIWNIEDYNKPKEWEASTKWEQKLNDFVWSLDDGFPRFRHLQWKDVFERQTPGNPLQVVKDTLFDHLPKFSLPLGEDSVKWTVWLSEDALWSRINTLSQVAVLQGQERENAVKLFKDVLDGDDVERNGKGEIAVHGVTYFAWTDRI
ncbi:putative Methyltransferase [Seiridium unicorne]|uniref:Methyltransferase n=1 Tax=Seiridium unicorne TaxID=138068 RepID=A0ABR2V222_9PEZI